MKISKQWTSLAYASCTAALIGCAKGEQASQSADSTARNLTLAPLESTAAMQDVPEPAEAPKPAAKAPKPTAQPAPRAPEPKPAAPVAPATLTVAAGTHVALSASDTITSRTAKAGDAFTATVTSDVRDAAGRVVIPAGSTVSGTITEVKPAPNPNSTGTLRLAINSVTVRGASYPLEASIDSAETVMKGRGVTAAEAGRVGGGAVAGAIAGRIIGKNSKGAIIGGVVGAAAGAAVSAKMRDVDIVLPKGAHVVITLSKPLSVKRS